MTSFGLCRQRRGNGVACPGNRREEQKCADEERLIHGATGRFQIDRLVPVAGKGIVADVADDGTTLTDVTIGLDELRSRTVFS